MRIATVNQLPRRRRARPAALFAIAAIACGAGFVTLWKPHNVMAMSVQEASQVIHLSHDPQELRAAATIVQQEAIRMVDLLRAQTASETVSVAQDARNYLESIADRAKE